MELTELVSPHIAMPVIGVVVCAIMVFAFGFRSPVQPPSFSSFEEEKRSKRRTKQTKSKGNLNGLVAANDQASEAVVKATSKPSKEIKLASPVKPASPIKPAATPKSAASPKAELNESKNVTKIESKQDIKGDKKGKSKKEAVKEDVKAEGGKRNKAIPAKKETEDDGEWTTIQVSKKSKKQKSSSKKDSGQAESAVEPESETENAPYLTSDAAAASSAVITSEIEESSSPKANKTKKKEGKLPGRSRAEGKEESQAVSVLEKPESFSNLTLNQEHSDGKRKKSKKDKKASASGAEAAASASENIVQDVAASGKATKKKLSQEPEASAQFSDLVTTEQTKPVNTEQAKPVNTELTKPVNTEQAKPVKTEQAKPVKTEQAKPVNTELTKPVKTEQAKQVNTEQAKPVNTEQAKPVNTEQAKPVNTEQAKPNSGKKKSKGKENIQEEKMPKTAGVQLKEVKKSADPVQKDANVQLEEVEKPVEIIKKDVEKSKAKTRSRALRVDPELSAAQPVVESVVISGSALADPVPVGISFDEIGDSWQEAAPKSKKKKPRKDN